MAKSTFMCFVKLPPILSLTICRCPSLSPTPQKILLPASCSVRSLSTRWCTAVYVNFLRRSPPALRPPPQKPGSLRRASQARTPLRVCGPRGEGQCGQKRRAERQRDGLRSTSPLETRKRHARKRQRCRGGACRRSRPRRSPPRAAADAVRSQWGLTAGLRRH